MSPAKIGSFPTSAMFDYFQPKRFETFHGKSVYSYLGIKFFKRHLLLTDLILFRARGKSQLDLSSREMEAELERLAWQTRRDETIHVACMIVIAAVALAKGHALSPAQWAGLFAINLYANLYPIFLQRHNRMRLIKLLARLKRAISPRQRKP
jgi:glycosyl-4,4'-diaponeurosporenoate acyltransferase